MGMLNSFLGGKKNAGPSVEDVIRMRQQGMPDQMIIQQLQQQRIPMPQVQDLMYHADVKMSVASPHMGPPRPASGNAPPMPPQFPLDPSGAGQALPPQMWPAPPPPAPPQMGPQPAPAGFGAPPPPPQIPPLGPRSQQAPSGPMMPPRPGFMGSGPLPAQNPGAPAGMDFSKMRPTTGMSAVPSMHTEELVEKIVKEKWKGVEGRVSTLEETKVELTNQVHDLQDELNELKSKYVQLQEDSTVRIEEYGKDLEGVGSQIKAMQRIMQNIIPDIAKNVKDLNDVVMKIKSRDTGSGSIELPKRIRDAAGLTREKRLADEQDEEPLIR